MKAHAVLADLTTRGVALQVEGSILRAIPSGRLTDELRQAIRTHKTELMVLVAANDVGTPHHRGIAVLTRLAAQHRHPLADLLDWYTGQVEDFATMPSEEATFIVGDYLARRELYWRTCCRKDEYRPLTPPEPVTPVTPPQVTCSTCTHFVPNPNSRSGIGDCTAHGNGSVQSVDRGQWHGQVQPPLWPGVKRECKHHEVQP